LTEVLSEGGAPIYLRTKGTLCFGFADKELPDHGRDYHKDGFGSTIGNWKNVSKAPELLTEAELHALGFDTGKQITLEFVSGVKVTGKIAKITRS
jgi:phenylalanine-4-hydroxylase